MRQIAAKRDHNEPKLVEYLRRCGASVELISSGGIPDLLVGWFGLNFLMEVKSDTGRLTEYQIKFFDTWRGQADIVRTIKDLKGILRQVMPVYVYQCPNCDRLEVQQRFAADPLEKCPKCEADISRVPQKVAVIYAVDGFTKRSKKNDG